MADITGGQYVPSQYTGSQSETIEYAVAETENKAKNIFLSIDRLLKINQWHNYCGFLSTAFQLTDSDGVPVRRFPQEYDYIRIDIPGPGTRGWEGI